MKQKWFRKMMAMALSATMMCTAMPIAASVNFEEGGSFQSECIGGGDGCGRTGVCGGNPYG